MAMLPCFHSVADSKFSLPLQLSRVEFVSLLLQAFSAFPCSRSLKFRNYANFKTASHCFFLPRNQQQILFFLHKNILTATHRVKLSPSIDLTTLILQWNRTEFECHFGSTAHFHHLLPSAKRLQINQQGFCNYSIFLDFTSCFPAFKSALYVHATQQMNLHEDLFHTILVTQVHAYRGVPLCSPVEMVGWSKLQDLFVKQSSLAAHSKRGQKICLCMCWVIAPML